MFIGRTTSWYRPYYVVASGRGYRVENIHFYKDNSILVSTNHGWLEKQNGVDIDSIEIPVDEIKVKKKENFDGKVFVISKGKESYSNELLCELYIPADMLGIHFVENKIEYKTQVRAIYKGVNDIRISAYVKSIDEKLNEIRNQYEQLHKECDGYNLYSHMENILDKLDKMKELAKQYIEEKNRINNLTIDDIEL